MISYEKSISFRDVRKIGELISPQSAQDMISAFQSQEPDGIFSILYGRHVFEEILAAAQCQGIRVFNAMNDKGDHALVFIGVDGEGRHINKFEAIFDGGLQCPFDCPKGGEGLGGLIWNRADAGPLDLSQIGEIISLAKADEMIAAYQAEEPDGVFSFLYGREAFEAILNVPGCAGIRIFNGLNDQSRHDLLFVGVNAHAGNIMQYQVTIPEGLHSVVAPMIVAGIPCSPVFPASALNVYNLNA